MGRHALGVVAAVAALACGAAWLTPQQMVVAAAPPSADAGPVAAWPPGR